MYLSGSLIVIHIQNILFRGTKVRHWSDSKYDYTETSHFNIYREGCLDFRNVPVDGSEKMPDDFMESIEPFDYSQMVDFETAYLAGYLADKYDVDQKSSIGRANNRIKQSTEEAFKRTVQGYATQCRPQAQMWDFIRVRHIMPCFRCGFLIQHGKTRSLCLQ